MSVEFVRPCKGLAVPETLRSTVPDETRYFIEQPVRTLHTQAVVTSCACRTCSTRRPYLVHATVVFHKNVTGKVIAHVPFSVPAVGT